MLTNKKEHNEYTPTIPHTHGTSQLCSIGLPGPTLHKPHPTTRTTGTIAITTTTNPRVPITQPWRPVLDADN
jgi:hypothetical protein